MNKTNDIEDIYPLSPVQHTTLLTSQLAPDSGVYITQLAFDLCGPLDVQALRAAWTEVTARHAVHRTLFARIDQARPLQVVRRSVELPWHDEDWRDLPSDDQEARFDAHLRKDRAHGFDPSSAPLMRCFLARLAADHHRFLWTRHHAISDGWSMPVVMGEIMRHYRSAAQGKPPSLGPVAQFRDYIAWLREQDLAKAEDYWRRSLADVHGPSPLGTGRPPAAGSGVSENIAKRRLLLSHETTRALQETARRERLTMSTFVQGAWIILLRRYGGDSDVLIGTIGSGRPAVLDGVESMVGCFVNTLPLRVRVDDEASALGWLRDLQAAHAEREEHGHVSLAQIRRWAGLPGDVPLFESLLVYENFPLGAALDAEGGALRIESVRMSEQTGLPLTLTVAPGDRMVVQLAYDEDRFDADVIARMIEHYKVILGALADGPGKIRDLAMTHGVERRGLVADWNRTRAEYPTHLGVHQLFEAQAAATPGATALIAGDTRVTYAELDARTNRLAWRLRERGVRPGAFVGVCLGRGPDLVAALLATLKVGAAYVPIDPAYPQSRVAQILDDAAPAAILVQESTRHVPASSVAPLLAIDAEGAPGTSVDSCQEAMAEAKAAPSAPVHYQSLAYVMYTSGSTGRPKGVRITHRNVVALLSWAKGTFSAEDLAGTLASTSVCFDVSILELFLPLATGGSVILAENALELPSLPARDNVTLVNTVPSAMDALLRLGELPERLRVVNLAGEAVPRDLVDRLYRREGIQEVYNLYGPTEDTVYSTFALVPERGEKPLIGRSIDNAQAYVLDPTMLPVPVGVTGELYLGGDGVAQGYHRRPSLTAERYVPDPFGGQAGSRLYRTGDLARRLADGQLEYLGRNDRQVKLRGFRIELGEIESALRRLSGIRDAVTITREDHPGSKRIVAYLVPEEGHAVDCAGASDALRETLPEHMIPSAFVELAAIPLTPNGKVDWQAFPVPEAPRRQHAYREPETEVEKVIAAVWADVLGISRPGSDDSFFESGGDSILLARVFGQLKSTYPDRVLMVDLYKYPTISALAGHIAGTETKPAFAGVQSRLQRRRAATGGTRDGGNR